MERRHRQADGRGGGGIAGLKPVDQMAATWPGVRCSVRTYRSAAMPMAPPRLRIRLNKPLASGISAAGQTSSASRVAGSRQNITANPRSTCGQNRPEKSLADVYEAVGDQAGPEQGQSRRR